MAMQGMLQGRGSSAMPDPSTPIPQCVRALLRVRDMTTDACKTIFPTQGAAIEQGR
jgi:hypothetical protein